MIGRTVHAAAAPIWRINNDEKRNLFFTIIFLIIPFWCTNSAKSAKTENFVGLNYYSIYPRLLSSRFSMNNFNDGDVIAPQATKEARQLCK